VNLSVHRVSVLIIIFQHRGTEFTKKHRENEIKKIIKIFKNMKKRSKFIFLLALACSLGHVQAQISYKGCSNDTTKNSSAIGFQSESRGECSFASGNYSSASGDYSFASGNNSSASGNYSFALGNSVLATGVYSFAIGLYTKADKNNSFVFGSGIKKGLTTQNLFSPANNSFLVGFENKPIFYAQLDSALSHRVGIGTTAPKTELDVLGTTRTGKLRVVNNTLEYTGGNLGFYPKNESSGGFDPGSEILLIPTLFLKDNGVGILTDNPKQGMALDVNGMIRAQKMRMFGNTFEYTGQKMGFYPAADVLEGSGGEFFTLPTLLLKNDRVGIMTDNPTSTLDVNGNIQADTAKLKKSIYLPNDELTFSYWWDGVKIEWDSEVLPEPDKMSEDSTLQGKSGPVSSGVRSWMTMTKVGGLRRIGINTNTPEATLHVNGTIKANKIIGSQLGEVDFLEITGRKINNQTFTKYLQFGEKGVVNGFGGDDFYFGNNWSVNSANNKYKRIKQGAASAILLKNDGTILFMNAPDGGAGTTITDYTYMCLDKGNLGIGKENPEHPLDVNGAGNFNNIRTNDIYFPGTEMTIRKISIYTPPGGDKGSGEGSEPKDGDDPESGQGDTTTHIAVFKSNGNVGIGTTDPKQTLHVGGDGCFSGNLGVGTTIPTKKLHVVGDSYLSGNVGIGETNPTKKLQVSGDTYITGNLCIGTTDNQGYKLAVKGEIGAKKVTLENTDNWPDYVFEKDYELMNINDLENFVTENKHLPGIPNKEEIVKNGHDIGEINRLLLEKMEEMTLYIIDLQKQINELKGR